MLDKPQSVAQRVQALQEEARLLARSHVLEMMEAVAVGTRHAYEISNGGDAYPPGVREVARKLAEDGDSLLQSLAAIQART